MCGIAGVFNSVKSKEKLLASLDKIRHRGGSIFEFEEIGLAAIGANRLPIVDRISGKQPQTNEERTIFVVQNGEIFNYLELQEKLKKLGHVFKTNSDTEVLAHLYEEYGVKMLDFIDSEMFAFIVYDAKKDSVFVARDPLGVKPLYYAKDLGGALLFASEIKQLAQFDDIETIHEFPAGHYFYNGKFIKYFSLKESKKKLNEEEALKELEKAVVNAVHKRVNTDLPIGVLLSGGVDSSLVMELAVRFHSNVTALILGYEGSSDYNHAVRLCKERGYKYHVITPHVDYEKELDELLLHIESFEPNVIKHSFANWLCAKEAQRLGLSIVLVGEGADELFGGYNEFSALSNKKISEGCKILVENMKDSQLKRVDRTCMRFTVEARCPFLDARVVETAFRISGDLKIKRENHRVTTKYILRKVAERFLPDYIAWRYKMPFANGAGMNVGFNYNAEDGDLASLVKKYDVSTILDKSLKKYKLVTAEEKYYFKKYSQNGFDKLVTSDCRVIIKDILYTLESSKNHRLVVAEFDKLALYFPAYLAAQKNIFGLHDLDVDFISTGGDDQTYATLSNNSAQIGISDPLFAMFENQSSKGEIIGELVRSVPLVAVSINPTISIHSLNDFSKYRIGTFQKFSTTHTVATSLLPAGTSIAPFEHSQILEKLVSREIDIAIVLMEYALDLEAQGGKIIYKFSTHLPHYLFSGLTVSGNLEPRHKKALNSFVASIKEAMKYISNNKVEALKYFSKIFPELRQPEKVIEAYSKFWVSSLKVNPDDYNRSHYIWKKNYPGLLKNHNEPYFRSYSVADPIIETLCNQEIRREYPFLEDILRTRIESCIANKEPIKLVGFWGAGSKQSHDEHDRKTIKHFNEFILKAKGKYSYGIEVNFLLADMHAINNGYQKNVVKKYLQGIDKELHKYRFQTTYLSVLWKKWGLSITLINKILQSKNKKWWSSVSINKLLEQRSAKDFIGDNKVLGAQKYYIMRSLEKSFLEKEFSKDIFIIYGSSAIQQIYPNLPSLYLYTEKKFYNICPWFSEVAPR